MNILSLLETPETRAGTELSSHSSGGSLRDLGHRVLLLHNESEVPSMAASYDGVLGVPALFDGYSIREPDGFRSAFGAVEAFLRAEAIDVIHIHNVPRLSALSWMIRRLPTVITPHVPVCPNGSRYLWSSRLPCDRKAGIVCLTQGYRRDGCGHMGNGLPLSLPGFVRGMYLNGRLLRLLSKSARVVAISHWMAGRLTADGVPASRIRVVPNAVLESAPAPSPSNAAQPPAVLFVGRVVDFKGADQLVRASALIDVPHQIWIVGDGPTLESLRAQASALGVADRVTFFGTVVGDDVSELRRRATVAVVPSLWHEAFGRVGVEAMAAGRPVVAYDVGGIRDWLTDGVTGRLVAVGDVTALAAAIEALLRDPDLARRMGEAGAAAAAIWTTQRHAQALVPVLEEARQTFAEERDARPGLF